MLARILLLFALAGVPALAAPVTVTPQPDGRTAVETGAVHALVGADGRLLELSLPGKPNLLNRAGAWNPGFGFTLGPAGDDAKPEAIEEWKAAAGKPEVTQEGDRTTVRIAQRFDPWLKGVKTLTFAAGKPYVRVRWEMELLKPARVRRFGVNLVSAPDADALAHPAAGGPTVSTGHAPGKYFRTPAADGSPGFPEFRQERWLALLARPRGEGIGFLFPDLAAWSEFRGQHSLGSFLKDGGYVLEFAHPGVTGADQGGPGYKDHPAGARLVLEMALLAFAGEAAPPARAALAEMGVAPPPADFPVHAIAFPTHLTADFTGGVPTFHLLPGTPLAPAFGFVGSRDKVQNLSLILDVPEGVTLAGAHYLHPEIKVPQPPMGEAVQRGALPYRRYRFAVPYRAIGREAPGWASVLAPFLEATTGFREADLVYHLEGSTGPGPEARVHLKALPALERVSLPKQFRLETWYQYTFHTPDPALRERLIDTMERVGVREKGYSASNLEVEKQLKARGWQLRLGMGWSDRGPYGFSIHNYGRIDWAKRGYPEDVWIVDDGGKRQVGVFCQSYIIGRGPAFVKEYREYLESLLTPNARALCWSMSNDYEVSDGGLMSATHSCFCPRCLEQFAKRSGLPAAEIATSEAILSKHRAEWTRFRMGQNAEIIRLHSEMLRQLAPGMQNAICSHWVADPPGSEVFSGEAIDVRLLDPYADENTPMMYHGGTRFFDNIQRTTRHLKKPVMALTAAFYDAWGNDSVVFSPEEVHQNLMAIAAAGSAGAGFYATFDHFDGAYLRTVQAAMAEIARLEPYLAGSQPADGAAQVEGLPREEVVMVQDGKERTVRIPDWPNYLRASVRRSGSAGSMGSMGSVGSMGSRPGDLVVAVFNYHRQEAATVRVKVPGTPAGTGAKASDTPAGGAKASSTPAGALAAFDPVSGRLLCDGSGRTWAPAALAEGIAVRVPPLSARFVVLRAPAASDKALPVEDTAAALQAWRKEFRRRTERQDSLSDGGITLGWAEDPAGARIQVRTPAQEVLIAPAQGGRIASWHAGGKTLAEWGGAKGDGVGVDLFWAPEKARWTGDEDAAYTVKERTVRDGAAMVVLERALAGSPLLAGLTLRKTYRVAGARPEVSIEYALENGGAAPVEAAFWSHHVLKPGAEALRAANQTPLYGCPLLVPWADGVREMKGAGSDSVFTVSAGGDLPGGGTSPLRKRATESMVGDRIAVAGPDASVVAQFERDKVAQVYSWRGDPPTHEWMYLPARIEPGKAWQTTVRFTGLPGATRSEVVRALRE